ncbi:MAG TPA: amino acid adenylation domain-containing protein [Pilimelia sp.]|nr:amino acid adenylation domain-containing protein [Pilimelia sp.]
MPIDHDSAGAVVRDVIARHLAGPTAGITPDTPLAALGLESLTAVRLRRQLAERTGVTLPLTALLGHRTVGDIAAALAAAAGAAPAAAPPAERAAGQAGAAEPLAGPGSPAEPDGAPLTPVQAAYWTGREPGLPLGGVATFWYHEYDRRPADPESDLAALEAAWDRLVRHHPMLRATVGRDGRQRVAAQVPRYRIGRTDLRRAAPEEAAAALAELRAQRSHQLLPTDRWPLFDLHAALCPDGRTRLFVGFDVLILDFASWRLLLRQWGRLVAVPEAELDTPPLTFLDVVRRRAADPAERARRDRDRAWWRAQGPSLPPAPDLPYAELPETLTGARFARHGRRLDAAAWAGLRAAATRHGVSATATLLAALGLALARWGADGGFTLNTTVYDRPDVPGADGIVGDFTSTALVGLPAVEPGTSFADYAADVNARFWAALDHTGVTGVEVLRDLPAAARPGFPVVFTSGVGLPTDGADWLGEEVYGVSQTPQVALDHLVWEEDGRLRICWDAAARAFPDGYVNGLADAHLRLLTALAAADASWRAPDLGWDPTFQVRQSPAPTPYPHAGPLLHDPVSEVAARTPHAPAVLGGGPPCTHADLAGRAAGVAAALRAAGVDAAEPVLVALPKCPDQIAAVLGVLGAGAAYVPVDPGWPAARIDAVCRRAAIRRAVVAPDTPAALPAGLTAVTVRPTAAAGGDTLPPAADHAATQRAYAIFTSGSTGMPKGVAVSHRAARTTIDDITTRHRVGPGDRVLGLSALSFDLSVYDIFGVLGAGGALVLPDPARQRDPQHWCQLISQHGVTVWNTAPALLEMLVEYAEGDPAAAAALRGLRLVLLSGDWIPVALPDRIRALAPAAEVISLGGATEAAIWSITYPIGDVDPGWSSIPYGRPLRGQFFYVLDPAGAPCPVGRTGELYIAGDGLADGYLGDAEQTAARFAVHPVLGERLYRTGDLGRWRADGTIEFLGRTDRQVKVRGHRIELGDVEAALVRHPAVRQAVASASPGPDGRPRLVAHVSLHDPLPDAERALARDLAQQLPDYLVPSRFLVLDALPVTENGKIDHRALPDPFGPPTPAAPAGGSAAADSPAADSTAGPAATGSAAPRAAAAGSPAPAAARRGPAAERGARTAAHGVRAALETALHDMLGPADFGLALIPAGATSLEVVRLANLVEDLTGRRPVFADLVAAPSITALLDDLAPADGPASVACAPPPEATPPGPAHPVAAHPAAPATDGIVLPPPPEGLRLTLRLDADPDRPLPDALRAAGDWLDAAAAQARRAGLPPPQARVADGPALVEVRLDRPQPTPAAVPAASPFPLTEMQLAYLVGRADRWLGDPVAPHYYTEVDRDDLDTDRLRYALAAVVARHPMLRATVTADTRQQVRAAAPAGELTVVDLSGLPPQERAARLEHLRRERSHRIVDPTRESTLHVTATRLGPRRWRIHFGLDLIFCDARSAATVADELVRAYDDPAALPPGPAATFADWTAAVAAAAAGPRRQAAEAYWRDRAGTLPDGPRLPIRPPGPGRVRFTRRRAVLTPDQWSALRGHAAAHGATPAAALLTAFADVLRAGTGQPAGTLVVTTFDRPPGHAGVVGDYTSTALVDVSGDAGLLAERARALGDRLLRDLEHTTGPHGVHGNEVLRQLTARRGRQVLLPVVFSSGLGSTVDGGGAAVDASQLLDGFGETVYAISQTPHVVLDCQVFEAAGELRVNWDAVEAAFPAGYLDGLFTAYREVLRALTDPAAWSRADPAALADRGLAAAVGSGPADRPVAVPDTRGAEAGSPQVGAPAAAARAAWEERITAALAELMAVPAPRLDPTRSFFECGATSLTLVTLHQRLRAAAPRLSVLDLFAHPSIRAAATHLAATAPAAVTPASPATGPAAGPPAATGGPVATPASAGSAGARPTAAPAATGGSAATGSAVGGPAPQGPEASDRPAALPVADDPLHAARSRGRRRRLIAERTSR